MWLQERDHGGAFLAGHDQTLRVNLEARVGGFLALRELVDAMERYVTGDTAIEDLGKAVRRVHSTKQNPVKNVVSAGPGDF